MPKLWVNLQFHVYFSMWWGVIWIIFLFLFLFLIEVYLIYSVVFISGVSKVIQLYMYLLIYLQFFSLIGY